MKVLSESGKIIGHIEDGVFTKRVKGSLHMLRMPPAWAIDETTFHHQVSPHAHTIRIEDTEADTAYEVDALIFAEQSTLLKRGHGNQLFLPLCRWAMKNKSQGALI